MTGSGHPDIPSIGFHSAGPDREIEVLDLARRPGPTGVPITLGRHRADFHAVFVVTEGRLVHQVDFAPVDLAAGTVTWIRPGAVDSVRDQTPARAIVERTVSLIAARRRPLPGGNCPLSRSALSSPLGVGY